MNIFGIRIARQSTINRERVEWLQVLTEREWSDWPSRLSRHQARAVAVSGADGLTWRAQLRWGYPVVKVDSFDKWRGDAVLDIGIVFTEWRNMVDDEKTPPRSALEAEMRRWHDAVFVSQKEAIDAIKRVWPNAHIVTWTCGGGED